MQIEAVADKLGLGPEHLLPYGRDKAKLVADRVDGSPTGKLVLVSAITPTRAGEGKTSVAIGLADAFAHRGRSVCLALREPSMGPCMGIKGGGAGGGQTRLVPLDDINLHFTGDFHAVTSAHNLLSAVIDNDLHFGSSLDLDPRRIVWPRVMDVSDRALRRMVIGLGGVAMGTPREAGFEITAASELMAILCLADDAEDLRRRIDRVVVGYTHGGERVLASSLGVTGAMLALLRDAVFPNLVQTMFGTPALVHGGPFANIAHGCNSVIATRAALRHADWVVTEAGFGTDLGVEKFFDIKCRSAGLDARVVVVVATVRALKLHGGVAESQLGRPDADAVERGLPNLLVHLHNVERFGKPAVVAINRFDGDTDPEVAVIEQFCAERGVPAAVTDSFSRGPAGAIELSERVEQAANATSTPFVPLYPLEASIPAKIEAVARAMYGARAVAYTPMAERTLERLTPAYASLPICIAKTQSSLSDDPREGCVPGPFTLEVRDLQVSAGAGFVVVLTRDIQRMPGLPRHPRAASIDLVDGSIVGLG